jgi:flagellar assembly protein FliH
MEQATAQASTVAIQAALQQGRREADAATKDAFQAELERGRAGLLAALDDFSRERSKYFRQVESEVVRLALAIARKILHREAQMDPLLLAGVVRVALDQIQTGSRIALRVPETKLDAWVRHFEQRPEGSPPVEIVGDSTVEPYGCVVQAEMGNTEISLDRQLQEIESGFFDLLQGASRTAL